MPSWLTAETCSRLGGTSVLQLRHLNATAQTVAPHGISRACAGYFGFDLYSGRKWGCVVHSYLQSLVKTEDGLIRRQCLQRWSDCTLWLWISDIYFRTWVEGKHSTYLFKAIFISRGWKRQIPLCVLNCMSTDIWNLIPRHVIPATSRTVQSVFSSEKDQFSKSLITTPTVVFLLW